VHFVSVFLCLFCEASPIGSSSLIAATKKEVKKEEGRWKKEGEGGRSFLRLLCEASPIGSSFLIAATKKEAKKEEEGGRKVEEGRWKKKEEGR
jgi:hypothetical protein